MSYRCTRGELEAAGYATTPKHAADENKPNEVTVDGRQFKILPAGFDMEMILGLEEEGMRLAGLIGDLLPPGSTVIAVYLPKNEDYDWKIVAQVRKKSGV